MTISLVGNFPNSPKERIKVNDGSVLKSPLHRCACLPCSLDSVAVSFLGEHGGNGVFGFIQNLL